MLSEGTETEALEVSAFKAGEGSSQVSVPGMNCLRREPGLGLCGVEGQASLFVGIVLGTRDCLERKKAQGRSFYQSNSI